MHIDGGIVTLKAVITITTDLGETFYPDDLPLAASLRALETDGDIFLRRTFTWTAGSRVLPINLDITRSEAEWPATLHVAVRNRYGYLSDHFERLYAPDDLPSVISVWSEALHPTKGSLLSSTRVQRQFTPLSDRSLRIFEDTGDSIARHLWYGPNALVHVQ